MRRTLVLTAALLVLWTVISQANHVLAGFHVYLFLGGLYVAYAALTQPLRPGLAASILGGLLCDAAAPGALFGLHALLFAAAHLGVYQVRDRVPRDETVSRVVVALLANLALLLVFSFSQIHRSPAPAALWIRLLADLVASQVLLALVAPWFFALQARALVLTRVDRESLD
jgi:rod shape-determining protein MreD